MLATVLLVLMVGLAVMGGWPWLKRWRPFTLAPADGTPPKTDHKGLRELERERDALQSRVTELERQTAARQPGELKGLCLYLSEKLRRFVDARQRTDPSIQIWQQRMKAETKKEKARLELEEIEAFKQHEAETIARYDETYLDRIMALYDDLDRRGWCGPEDRPYFECPENSTEIQEVAKRLEAIGHRLSEG